MTPPTAAVPWLIDPGGVGALRLGQPVPASLLGRDLEAGYVAGYLGDGVTYEGFRLESPPVVIVLSRGPWMELERRGHHGPLPYDLLRPTAMAVAKDGATIQRLMVHGKGLATAKGAGVGSTLAELQREYGEVVLQSVPPTLGDDRGVATVKDQPGLAFYFGSFDAAHVGGVVTRVDVWIPER